MNIIEKEDYLEIYADNGMVLTFYTDDKPISEYESFTIAYAPKNTDLSVYREITLEEDAEYRRRKQEDPGPEPPEVQNTEEEEVTE